MVFCCGNTGTETGEGRWTRKTRFLAQLPAITISHNTNFVNLLQLPSEYWNFSFNFFNPHSSPLLALIGSIHVLKYCGRGK